MDKLLKWKENKETKLPLLIYGARQVGKTYIMKEFGKTYKNTIYINFEKMDRVGELFNNSIEPNHIITSLEAYFNERIIPDETLIIFDEVQVCNRALTSLKYFAEDAPEYNIMAAGSLLGVCINRENFSFPVGKVDMLTLYPLDFEEFLIATKNELLLEEIKKSFESNNALIEGLHQKALELYRIYLTIGGMPEVVLKYINGTSMLELRQIQDKIIASYIIDSTKYATASESTKIITAYNSIPMQLGKENKKFQYKLLKSGATATMFRFSIEWLISSGIALKCKKVTQGIAPLEFSVDLSSFKLYMSDVGLLGAKAEIEVRNTLLNENFVQKGSVTENYIAQCFVANGKNIYYWESSSIAEVDFVLQQEGKVIPVEVKSDINVRSRSLDLFMKRYNSEYGIRISARNFGFENNIKAVPLYATFLI